MRAGQKRRPALPVEPGRVVSAFPIDAALEGFRFTREHPRAIAVWGAVSFVAGLAGAAILIVSGAQAAIAALPAPDPADAGWMSAYAAALPRILPGATLQFLLSVLVFTLLACSAFRALLRTGGAATLRLGADELRVISLTFTLAAIGLGVGLVADGVTALFAVLAGGPSNMAGTWILFFGEAVKVCLTAVVMVRLALASPLAVAERRWSLAESWRRTRGRFWPMLGALVIAALLYLIVAFLVSQLFLRLGMIAHMAEGGGNAPRAGLAQLTDPAVLIIQAGLALAFALGIPILAGPLAYAYRAFR